MNDALGFLETTGFTPAMVALDAMEKIAGVRVVQAELNDFLGVCIKVAGTIDEVRQAVETGRRWAERLGGRPVVDVVNRCDEAAWRVIQATAEYNPLIQQQVVMTPADPASLVERGLMASDSQPHALGFIETQGFTAVFEAIDTACKAANVEVVGKEKLGGGYVTVIVKGDVAAVNAAVAAGRAKVEGLGTLIAAHVIARPSTAVLSLLPA